MGIARLALRFRNVVSEIDTISEHRQFIRKKGFVLWGWWRKAFEPTGENQLSDLIGKLPFDVVLCDAAQGYSYLAKCTGIVFNTSKSKKNNCPPYYRAKSDKIPVFFKFTKITATKNFSNLHRIFRDRTILFHPFDAQGVDIGENQGAAKQRDELPKSQPRIELVARVPVLANRFSASLMRKPEDKGFVPLISGASVRGNTLLHVSDLHVGDDHAFLVPEQSRTPGAMTRTLSETIIKDLQLINKENDIVSILGTGDFVSRHGWTTTLKSKKSASYALGKTFEHLCEALTIPKESIFLIPGNHDYERLNAESQETLSRAGDPLDAVDHAHEIHFRTFLQKWRGEKVETRWQGVQGIASQFRQIWIGVLDSCRMTPTKLTEYGYVDPLVLEEISKELRSKPKEDLKILLLHHHVVPVGRIDVPDSSAVSLTLNAGEILTAAQWAGVQLILHGHQHVPQVAMIAKSGRYFGEPIVPNSPIVVVSGASAGAKIQGGNVDVQNMYTLIEVFKDHFFVRFRRLDHAGGSKDDAFDVARFVA
jgi:3',5'-cyclic AMP phosphodiesterase CpdA